jgi:CheY-like chemotaxis protein
MPLVAILDDRATNRHIFARLAQSIEPGISVRTFEDPVAALDWLAGNTPDIVITDFKMPNLDGAQFTRRFRELPGCSDVPVVVITVYDERSFRLSALEAGRTDFLQSPVDHSEFVTRARNLLRLRKQQLLLKSTGAFAGTGAVESEQTREAVLRDSRERLAQIIDTVPGHDQRDGSRRPLHLHQRLPRGSPGHRICRRRRQSTTAIFGKSRAERSRKLDRIVFETGKALPAWKRNSLRRTAASACC